MKNRKLLHSGWLPVALFALVALSITAVPLHSAPIMPDFATFTDWTTDRYEPASFTNVGPYEGRTNVLGISIDASTNQIARGGQGGLFNSTQGRKFIYPTPMGAGSVLSADLYIPASWGNSANGHVRTDMWGTMINGANAISAYPIAGFTNYGGVPRLRVWDSHAPGGWVDLPNTVNYDTWTTFAIELLADSSFNFYVNGVLVYADVVTGGSVAFKEVIMQAFNFEHTDIAGAIVVPYTAHWANTAVPVQVDFTITPSSPFVFDTNNVFGVYADAAPGFPTGSFVSNGAAKTDMYFTPVGLFARAVLVGQIESMSYWTNKGTTHEVDPADWFLAVYTKPFAGDVSTPNWYGSRFGSEPYFSVNPVDPANTWNQWTTDGATNQLRFFESTEGAPGANFGSYTDPTWTTFLGGNSLGTAMSRSSQAVLFFSVQTGSAWAAGFTGQVDGLRIQLNDGSVATINFEPDPAVDADPPVALDTAVTPGSVVVTSLAPITVTALIDDTLTGGSEIVSAAFSVNGGAWTPMAASDTAFDSASESVTGTFTLTDAGISIPGVYSVCVRGTDAAGQVSNVDCEDLTVIKANAVVSVSGYTGVYDGAAHGATGTATGVGGVDLSSGLNLGLSFTNVPGGTANWTFTGGTNYNDQLGAVPIVITPKTVTVTPDAGQSKTYGAADPALTYTLSEAISVTGLLGRANGENVGSYAINLGTLASGSSNHVLVLAAGTVNFTIGKADATILVTGYTGIYDGAAHGATGTATGVMSEPLAGLDLGASFTNVPGGMANWVFTDVTGNYNNANGSVAIVISKANATISVTGYTGIYDGAAHGATGTATGVLSEALAGLDLGASFTNVSGGTANWVFTDVTGNYNNANGSVAIVITPKDATVTANNKSKVYNTANPTLDAVVAGTIGSEVLDYTLSTTAVLSSPVSNPPSVVYPITVNLGSNPNYNVTPVNGTLTITTGFNFFGFHSPIGGSVENTPSNGGSFGDPVRAFKLKSTIPVKFSATWITGGAPLLTGNHTLQAIKYSNMTDYDTAIDVSPTDSATTGNLFRLTDGQWHFNLSTKSGFSQGTWLLVATLEDGSKHTVWISIKK